MGELMAAKPVSVPAAELSRALATGAVEAFMTSSQTGVDSRVYEHVKYFYDMRAALPKNAVFVNTRAFEALDKSQQAVLRKLASAAEERGWKASREWDDKSKLALAQMGVLVLEPSVKLASDAKLMGFSLLQAWQKNAGPEGEAIVANYQRTAAFGAAPQAGAGKEKAGLTTN
jgi:TRAP-type C4-dicarboxylate transport system substrate-binding protein